MTPSLHLRAVTLRVSDLARSQDFYARQLGFVVISATPTRAELAVTAGAPVILTLEEDRSAASAPGDSAGLFHAALLLPDRAALGAWLRHAADQGVKFDGFSDHGVSEALYFTDPDGNGLEFYADRPRSAWPFEHGELAMFTHALNLPSLLAEAAQDRTSPLAGASWGHLHLRVTQLERSVAFYASLLGMVAMQRSFPGAQFLAADGYHHHLGLNTWGRPQRPYATGALGLASATFGRKGQTVAQAVVDPDGIPLRVEPL